MMRRTIRTIQSALWWVISIALVLVTIGGTAELIHEAPGWSLYRAGGLNPVVKLDP